MRSDSIRAGDGCAHGPGRSEKRFAQSRRRKAFLAAAALGACSLASPILRATLVTDTWLNATTGDWTDPTKWSAGVVPNNGADTYDATIGATGVAYTVTLSTSNTVNSLTLSSADATLSHTAGTFTATGALNLQAGTYSLAGGTIANTTINATVPLFLSSSTGSLIGDTINGNLDASSGFARALIGTGTTFNTAHLGGQGSELGFVPGYTLGSTILFEGSGISNRYLTMQNPGAFTIGPGGVVKTVAGLGTDGQIGGGGFVFSGSMNLTNSGLISSEVSGRAININATTFTNAGTVQALNGANLNFNSTSYTNNGTIIVNASTLNLGGTFNATGGIGNFSNTAGTINITGTLLNTGNTLTLSSVTGSWNLSGGTISGGTINFLNGRTLNLTSTTGAINGVTVNGDLNFTDGFARASIGNGTTFGTAHLAGQGAEIGFQGGSTLSGNISFEGSAITGRFLTLTTSGAFTIPSTSIVKTAAGFASDAQIGGSGFVFAGSMNLLNNGQISSEISGRTINISAAAFSNAGTISALNGGIVTINGNYTNTGTIVLNASTLNLGGTFNATSGIGNFANTAGTVNITGTVNNTGNNLTLNSLTGSWNLLGGTISGGTISTANGQALNLTSTTGAINGVSVNGDLNFAVPFARASIGPGTTFNVAHLSGQGSEIGFGAGATLNSTVQAEGSAISSRFLTMSSSGGFTIAPTGVLKTVAGLGTDLQIGGSGFVFAGSMNLLNNGLISSEVSGRAININATTFTNAGTVQALNGGIVNFNSPLYTNTGTIIVNSSTLNLGGTFNATGGIGNFANTAGTVNITGTVNNTGNNLTLNSLTGSWNLSGGTLSGGSLSFANGQTLVPTSTTGTLSGITVNGDLQFTNSFARALLANGTSFNTAHLLGQGAEIGFTPGSTLSSTISFEGSAISSRFLTLSAAGSFAIASTGVVKTVAGLNTDAQIGGGGFGFSGAMNLLNNGLISSEVSGRTININASSFSNAGTIQAINGGRVVIDNAVGTLGHAIIDGNTGLLRVNGGTYTIDQTLVVTHQATANLKGSWTRTGNIDASGRIIFDYPTAGPSVYADTKAAIISGFNHGAWNGSGIFSSAAAANNATAVGYAEASSILGPTGGMFSGETVDGSAVLLRWTYKGDANLDGKVDVTDLGALATNWQTSSDWSGGDFNYDGLVDVTDLGALATNWQQGVGNPLAPSFERALASVGLAGTSVPEPGVGLLLIALCVPSRRRCRSHR